MHLKSLQLQEFRKFNAFDFSFAPEGLGIFGANASGKTTLLEAICMLALTKSPRASSDRELINFDSGKALGVAPFARLQGDFDRADGEHRIEIGLETPENGAAPMRKLITVDGQTKRSGDAVGALKCVLFEPEELDLVTGSPSLRRRYLDQMICQIDRLYLRTLSRYVRIVEQRNSLLKALQKSGVSSTNPVVPQQLSYWDEELILHGASVISRRHLFVERLAVFAHERHGVFSPGHDLELKLRSSVGELPELFERNDAPTAERESVVARRYLSTLQESLAEELRRGMTLIGPHRDDLVLTLDNIELSAYGSRGQQRLAIVALKLGEADIIRDTIGESPILLLDDVLSELDPEHRQTLLLAIGGLQTQIFLSATDRDDLTDASAHLPQIMELRGGQLVGTEQGIA